MENNLTLDQIRSNATAALNGQQTYVNPNAALQVQGLQSPITADSLTQNVSPLQLPNTPTPTDYRAPIASVGSLLERFNQTSQAENTQNDITTQILNLTKETLGKDQALQTELANQGVPEQQKQLQDLMGQLTTLQAESQAIPLEVQQESVGRGRTAAGVAPIEQSRLRENAIKSLTIGAQASALQGNISLASQLAQQAVDAKFAPAEQQLEFLKTAYQLNKDTLDRIDAKKSQELQINLAERERLLTNEKEDSLAAQKLAITAAQNGAPQDVISAITQSGNINDAIAAYAPYSQNPVELAQAAQALELQRAQTAAQWANVDKLNREAQDIGTPAITNPEASKYQQALGVILGSNKFTKDQKASVINAVNNGEDPFTVIKNQAKDIMGQTNATTLDKYETAKSQMQDIQSLLKQYYVKGGKTNVFNGNYEKVLNNLGTVNDPELVGIATNIAAALQIYRNAVSGTAYSEQEGKDIASIFPGINKTEGLNMAILDGRLKAFDTTIDATYTNTLGSTYKDLKASELNKSSAQSEVQFVSDALQNNGVNFADVIKNTPRNMVAVVDNKTGDVGYVSMVEFNTNDYTRIQ